MQASKVRLPCHGVLRVWLWEFVAIAVAFGLNIAVAALLVSYDKQPVPDWGSYINLNALLALLSTMLRAILVLIASQIICQRKWDWYGNQGARPLSDLQDFDAGSRGSLGAFFLIPTVLRRDIATLVAAIVTITSFLVGPFVQQASRVTECTSTVPGLNASLLSAHFVYKRALQDVDATTLSIITNPDGLDNLMKVNCPTGNCTFPNGDAGDFHSTTLPKGDSLATHSTVATCSKCVDAGHLVTSRIKEWKWGNSTDYALPNGIQVNDYAHGMSGKAAVLRPESNLTWLGATLSPHMRSASRWSYINATFLGANKNGAVASVCVLYPCLRTYSASVTNNVLSETHVRSEPMKVDLDGQDPKKWDLKGQEHHLNGLKNEDFHYTAVESPCQVGGRVFESFRNTSDMPGATKLTLYDLIDHEQPELDIYAPQIFTAPEQCIYRHHAYLASQISSVFHRDIFNGSCSGAGARHCSSDETCPTSSFAFLGARSVLQSLYNSRNPDFNNITHWFDTVANAMTNRLRMEYGAERFNKTAPRTELENSNLGSGEIKGLAWKTNVCVSAQKEWLLLPLCLTLAVAIVLAWSALKNSRSRSTRPVWKDSILPMIFHSEKFEIQQPEALPEHSVECCVEDGQATLTAPHKPVWEAAEMHRAGRDILVIFQWPNGVNQSAAHSRHSSSESHLQHESDCLRRRSPQSSETNTLLPSNHSPGP